MNVSVNPPVALNSSCDARGTAVFQGQPDAGRALGLEVLLDVQAALRVDRHVREHVEVPVTKTSSPAPPFAQGTKAMSENGICSFVVTVVASAWATAAPANVVSTITRQVAIVRFTVKPPVRGG